MDIQSDHSSNDFINFKTITPYTSPKLAYPWLSLPTKSIQDPSIRMHNQIIDFYLFVTPSPSNRQLKTTLENFKKVIREGQPSSKILTPFFDCGLYLNQTQIQLYVFVNDLNSHKEPPFAQKLRSYSPNHFVNLQSTQKYPIYEYEINLSTPVIVRVLDSSMYEYISEIGPAFNQIIELRYLYIIFSSMIRQRWLNVGIRPFVLFGMLLLFYSDGKKNRGQLLSQHLIKFLEFASFELYPDKQLSYMGQGRFQIGKDPSNSHAIVINGNNVSCHQVRDFVSVLKNRYRVVANYNYQNCESIVGALVNPSKSVFQY